jgi:hypothetical protein
MTLGVLMLLVIATGCLVLFYRQQWIRAREEARTTRRSEDEKSKALEAQREESAQHMQTIVILLGIVALLRRQQEERDAHARAVYVELQETARDAGKFRSLSRFFEKEASYLASQVDALSAARLAAEKKELGARIVEYLFGFFFPGCQPGRSYS